MYRNTSGENTKLAVSSLWVAEWVWGGSSGGALAMTVLLADIFTRRMYAYITCAILKEKGINIGPGLLKDRPIKPIRSTLPLGAQVAQLGSGEGGRGREKEPPPAQCQPPPTCQWVSWPSDRCYSIFHCVSGQAPWETDSETEICMQQVCREELWGTAPLGEWRQDWAEGEAGLWCCHNKGLSRSQKELWSWEGSSEWSQHGGRGLGLRTSAWPVTGWGLPLGKECNFGQSNSLQLRGRSWERLGCGQQLGGMNTSALKGNLELSEHLSQCRFLQRCQVAKMKK